MITRQEKVDLLVFRMKNMFRNNRTCMYTKDEVIELFSDCNVNHIVDALNLMVENHYVTKTRNGRSTIYFYKRIPTRTSHAYDSLFDDIYPDMTFGVEFELGSKFNHDVMRDILEEAGFEVQRFCDGSKAYTKWAIVNDGSIHVNKYNHDVEIVSPVLQGEKGLRELKQMCDLLSDLKKLHIVAQNRSCGTHVHMSARKFVPIVKLIDLMEKSQSIMNKFVYKHRTRDDDYISSSGDYLYCSPVTKEKYFNGRRLKGYYEKYVNLNITNFNKNGTVEFRQLHGTTSFIKIASWIIMNEKIIRAGRKCNCINRFKSINHFCKFVGIRNDKVKKGLLLAA